MIERIRALRKAGAPVSLLAIDASSADLTPPPVPTPEQEEGVRARAKEMNSEAFIPVLLNAAAATTVRDRVMAQLVGDALRRTTLSTSALGGAAWACLPGGSGCGPLPFPPSNEQRTARGAGVYLSGELQDYDGLDNLKGYDGLIVFARATPAEPAVPTPAQAPGKRSRPQICLRQRHQPDVAAGAGATARKPAAAAGLGLILVMALTSRSEHDTSRRLRG